MADTVTKTYNLADLFEVVAAACPDRLALVAGEHRLTYAELDHRAERTAVALSEHGISAGDWVGVLSYNRVEWVELMISLHKLRAVPINVNYRYTATELRHVMTDAGVTGMVYERGFTSLLETVLPETPGCKTLIELDDGTSDHELGLVGAVSYDAAVRSAAGTVPATDRSSDDRYVVYTGGTTGLPKGVVWRCEDIFFGAFRGGNVTGPPITSPDQLAQHAEHPPRVTITMAPLMHGGAQWTTWISLTNGGTLVLSTDRSFDAEKTWQLIALEGVQTIQLIGDAMGRPLAESFDSNLDISKLTVIANGAAPMSEAVRTALRKCVPNVKVVDSYGSSEAGADGTAVDTTGGTRTFRPGPQTAVLDDDLRPLPPGSAASGLIARRGYLPLGYHNDPSKTATTFLTDPDGVRWVISGDRAIVEPDGSIRLLGRGNTVINTGGEKVYPDEVEAQLKADPSVFDAVVVGVPDPRFGEQVTALVTLRGDHFDEDALRERLRAELAGYKVPKRILVVAEVRRTPAGKPEYRWAREYAAANS